MADRIRCQDCQNKKSPPVGMVRWPTDDDDYICIVCLRERFAEAVRARDEAQKGSSEWEEECDSWREQAKHLESCWKETEQSLTEATEQIERLQNELGTV